MMSSLNFFPAGGKGLTSNPDSSPPSSTNSVTGPASSYYSFVSLLGLTTCSLLLITLTGVIIALFRKAFRNHHHGSGIIPHQLNQQQYEEHINHGAVTSTTGASFSMKHHLTSDLSSLTSTDSIFGAESTTCLENQILSQPQYNQCPLDLTFDIKHAINYETSV